MTRLQHTIKVIDSAAFLASYSIEGKPAILDAAAQLLQRCWKLELQAIMRVVHGQALNSAVENYWLKVSKALEGELHKFSVVHDETINPPGKCGFVQISFQDPNSVGYTVFKLEGVTRCIHQPCQIPLELFYLPR